MNKKTIGLTAIGAGVMTGIMGLLIKKRTSTKKEQEVKNECNDEIVEDNIQEDEEQEQEEQNLDNEIEIIIDDSDIEVE